MKLLFIGYAIPEDELDKVKGASVAGNKMQLNILRNIENFVEDLKVVSVYPEAVFPKGPVFCRKKFLKISECTEAECPGFINFPIIKQFSQIHAVYRVCKRYIKNNPDAKILTFNMFSQVGNPAVRLKKKYKSEITTIIADLPIDDKTNRKGLSKILRKLFEASTRKNLLQVDKAVTLNKKAVEIFAPPAKYIVIDGGANISEYKEPDWDHIINIHEKNIVYCGSLNQYSGIMQLIEAMSLLKSKDVVLDIYGDGQLKEYVITNSSDRIRYHGSVSNKEILDIQRGAWLLAQPRPTSDKIAQLTFPSKIFEYMMSGTPILSTRLNGFSEVYEDKLIFTNDNPKSMAKEIDIISNMLPKDLLRVAQEAYSFVTNERNWELQTQKIYKVVTE